MSPHTLVWRCLPAAALFVAAACAAPRAAPSPPAQPAIGAVPDAIGDHRLVETRPLASGAAGTLYRYRGDTALEPDIYIYPLTSTALEGGSEPQAQAQAESELFKQTLELQRRQGRFDEYTVVAERPLRYRVGNVEVAGWQVQAMLTRGGEPRETQQHLLVIGDQLVKVRTSFEPGSVSPAQLKSFVEGLVRGLVGD